MASRNGLGWECCIIFARMTAINTYFWSHKCGGRHFLIPVTVQRGKKEKFLLQLSQEHLHCVKQFQTAAKYSY